MGNSTIHDRDLLVQSRFEQKWTDLVLGEIQEHISVTCMEQGGIAITPSLYKRL